LFGSIFLNKNKKKIRKGRGIKVRQFSPLASYRINSFALLFGIEVSRNRLSSENNCQ